MVEILAVLWRATPSPQEHLLGDDLVAALALLDHIAAAEEQQSCLPGDMTGADDGAAGGAFVLAGERVRHDELAELLDKAVIATQVVIALGRWRLETDLDGLAGSVVCRRAEGPQAEAACFQARCRSLFFL